MAPLLSAPLLRTQSDRRLVALVADGHDRAFEAIVERYRRPLQRYLRKLLSEALAEDVLQASFVRAWQALRSGTDVRELRPWLYRIAHNQALNTLRAAGSVLPPASADLPAISLEAEIERREELRETLSGIEALPDRQRAALIAIAVAGRSHADVARELGMTDGALRQLLLRARTTLRAAATALTPYPVMSWLADGQEATAARVAEVAVGAGGAGAALKASAAVLAAGAVVAGGPALRGDHPTTAKRAPAAHEGARQAAPRNAGFVSSPAPSADHEAGDQGGPLDDHPRPVRRSSSGEHSGSGHGKHGSSHRSGSSGSGSSGEGGSGENGSGKSGSGKSGDSGEEGSGHGGSSGSGSGKSGDSGAEDSDRGGRGSGEDDSGTSGSRKQQSGKSGAATEPVATTPSTVTIVPESDSGEDGSGGEGSGGGGSGDEE
jgi:RNA polymerase sigma factor (sigma-70 family)